MNKLVSPKINKQISSIVFDNKFYDIFVNLLETSKTVWEKLYTTS